MIKILLTIPYFEALFKVNIKHVINIFSIFVYIKETSKVQNSPLADTCHTVFACLQGHYSLLRNYLPRSCSSV